MKKGLFFLLISVSFLWAGSETLAGEFYKWIGKDGVLHISDKNPPPSKKAKGEVGVIRFKSTAIPPSPEISFETLSKFRGFVTDSSRSDAFVILDRSKKWGFLNEKNGSVTTANQSLLLTAKGDSNIYQNTFTAPILSQDIGGVNKFSAQVSIEYKGEDEDNATGIILFTKGTKKWLTFSFSSGQNVGWKDQDGKGNEIPYKSDRITLKIFHFEGNSFLYYVEDDKWKLLDEVESGGYNALGLFAFSWLKADVTANFRNFVFTVKPAPKSPVKPEPKPETKPEEKPATEPSKDDKKNN